MNKSFGLPYNIWVKMLGSDPAHKVRDDVLHLASLSTKCLSVVRYQEMTLSGLVAGYVLRLMAQTCGNGHDGQSVLESQAGWAQLAGSSPSHVKPA